jgi:hypothetical protein
MCLSLDVTDDSARDPDNIVSMFSVAKAKSYSKFFSFFFIVFLLSKVYIFDSSGLVSI